jgi:hypothetical protein
VKQQKQIFQIHFRIFYTYIKNLLRFAVPFFFSYDKNFVLKMRLYIKHISQETKLTVLFIYSKKKVKVELFSYFFFLLYSFLEYELICEKIIIYYLVQNQACLQNSNINLICLRQCLLFV